MNGDSIIVEHLRQLFEANVNGQEVKSKQPTTSEYTNRIGGKSEDENDDTTEPVYMNFANFEHLCARYNIPTEQITYIFNELDRNGNGRLSCEEFIGGFIQLISLANEDAIIVECDPDEEEEEEEDSSQHFGCMSDGICFPEKQSRRIDEAPDENSNSSIIQRNENPTAPQPRPSFSRLQHRKVHPAMRRANSLIHQRRLSSTAPSLPSTSSSLFPEETSGSKGDPLRNNSCEASQHLSSRSYEQLLQLNCVIGNELENMLRIGMVEMEDLQKGIANGTENEGENILVKELVKDVQALLMENKQLIEACGFSELNLPESTASTTSPAEYSAILAGQIDSMQRYTALLDAINGQLSNDADDDSGETNDAEEKQRRQLAEQLQKTLADSARIKAKMETIRAQINLANGNGEEGVEEDYAEQMLHGEVEASARELSEEWTALKQTSRALEHTRKVLEIRQFLESHKKSSAQVVDDLVGRFPKTETWFQKRDSFQVDNVLVAPLLRSYTGQLVERIPKVDSEHFWRDSIEKSDSIVSDDESGCGGSSSTRRVSFSEEIEIFQEQKGQRRNSKWTLSLDRNISKMKSSVRECSNGRGARKLSNERESPKLMKSPTTTAYDPTPHLLKIIFIGDSMVGKTSFICRATRRAIPQITSTTIGIDFKSKVVLLGEEIFMVQLWDTAGQERFRSISMNYFRKVDAICLMYDVSNVKSFINVRWWVNSIMDTITSHPIPLMIVANKTDLRDHCHNSKSASTCTTNFVSTRDGHEMVRSLQLGLSCQFVETSVYRADNVDDIVEEIVQMIRWNWRVNRARREETRGGQIRLDGAGGESRGWGCC